MAAIFFNIGLQAATPADPANEGQSIFENMLNHPQEHWYNLTLMNTKIGYMHTSYGRGNLAPTKTEYQGKQVARNKNRYRYEL